MRLTQRESLIKRVLLSKCCIVDLLELRGSRIAPVTDALNYR